MLDLPATDEAFGIESVRAVPPGAHEVVHTTMIAEGYVAELIFPAAMAETFNLPNVWVGNGGHTRSLNPGRVAIPLLALVQTVGARAILRLPPAALPIVHGQQLHIEVVNIGGVQRHFTAAGLLRVRADVAAPSSPAIEAADDGPGHACAHPPRKRKQLGGGYQHCEQCRCTWHGPT